jgi:uncharacterized membrane protein YcaP (DUF421 family)
MTFPDWLVPFLTIDTGLLDKVLRTIVVYLAIAVLIRVGGKRLLAQMNSLDLVVVLLLSNVVQNAIIGPDNSVLGGLVGACVLVGFNALVDRFVEGTTLGRRLLVGTPTDLISDGRVDAPALSRLGISVAELDLALRRQGADAVSEVERATLEPEGVIVVTLKPEERDATLLQLRESVAELKELIASLDRTQPNA